VAVGRFPWRCKSMSPPTKRLRSGPVIGKSDPFERAAGRTRGGARALHDLPSRSSAVSGATAMAEHARSPVALGGRFANNRRARPCRPAGIVVPLRVDSCSSLGAVNDPPRQGELVDLLSSSPYPIAEPSPETL